MDRTHAVAVIGAGFSGVMTTVHLLRAPGRLRVILINRTGRMARGVAFGTRSPAHLLNVPAGRMSAFPDDPDHFLRYARAHDSTTNAASFLPRSVYGAYLEAVLEEAERGTAGRLDRVVGEVATIDAGAPARLTTTNGGVIYANRVALALGNYPPRDPAGLDGSALGSPHYLRDPWAPDALAAADGDRSILLIGTGLTMMDVALDLHARGAWGADHGCLPPRPIAPGACPRPAARPGPLRHRPARRPGYDPDVCPGGPPACR